MQETQQITTGEAGQGSVGEVARLALKLGFTAFGGPAAHIAMLRDEVVTRRKWLTDEHFMDLLGATNLIPGPNSTEMVIHVGHVRAGWRGLIVGGVCFILPSACIVLLTDRQLLDAVAIGQFTPGPVFTTATFIGYVLGSWPGAILATVGIFLPAFVFVAAVNPLIPRLRASPWMGALLDGVNVTALGLMAAVTWQLGRAAVIDGLTALLAIVAAVLLLRFKVNSDWLVLGGGLVGVIVYLIG